MEKSNEKNIPERSIQDYLSLGYIYLLALGIIREVIYYNFIDVNILSYSNILDVILSPLVYIAESPIVIITLIIFAVLVHYLNKHMAKKKNKAAMESGDSEGPTFSEFQIIEGSIILFAFLAFSFFIGTGLGSGNRLAQKLKSGKFKISHEITFLDQEKIQARLIGSNSQYIFYVLENEKKVTISPISGMVKKITKLPPKKE